MKGYLNAEANAKFQALGGWIRHRRHRERGMPEGYLHILGADETLAKGEWRDGEPHGCGGRTGGAFPQYGLHCQTAVITRPRRNKGEMLIAVTNEPKLTPGTKSATPSKRRVDESQRPGEIKVVKEIPKPAPARSTNRELQALMSARNDRMCGWVMKPFQGLYDWGPLPRVARSSQPWAKRLNPVGILERKWWWVQTNGILKGLHHSVRGWPAQRDYPGMRPNIFLP